MGHLTTAMRITLKINASTIPLRMLSGCRNGCCVTA
jgi:hypothetical protein